MQEQVLLKYLKKVKDNIQPIIVESQDIKKPKKEYYSYHVAKEKAGLRLPTYSKGISLSDTDNSFTNKIIYEYYNTKREN